MNSPVALFLLVVSVLGIGALFAFYPLFLRIAAALRPNPHTKAPSNTLSVTVITVARNGAELITGKVANTLGQDYPPELLDAILFSDGSTDGTVAKAGTNTRLTVLSCEIPRGKANGLNTAALQASGDILVFSDTDAVLSPGAVRALMDNFADPMVGGVVGRRLPRKEGVSTEDGQSIYADADSGLKGLETLTGSVTSNDGKLYAIRRSLFRPIAPDATDDLYNALSVIRQGYRFVYEPAAQAQVSTPSRDAKHEISRRRRIVCRSLTGIFRHREVLNINKFGTFAVGLLINKVLRRMLPVLLMSALVSSAILAAQAWWAGVFLALQVLFYSLATLHFSLDNAPKILKKASSVALYFSLGNIGTFLGAIDFIRGKRVDKWEPRKTR